MTPSTIKLHPSISAPQFGANPDFFEQHIAGRDLPVLDYLNGFYLIGAGGETFTVHKSDIDKNYRK